MGERLGLGVIKSSQIQLRVNLLPQRREMVVPEKKPKRGAKKTRVVYSSPGASPARQETPRPNTGGKSPRVFSIKGPKPKKESSDVDTSSTEPNSE